MPLMPSAPAVVLPSSHTCEAAAVPSDPPLVLFSVPPWMVAKSSSTVDPALAVMLPLALLIVVLCRYSCPPLLASSSPWLVRRLRFSCSTLLTPAPDALALTVPSPWLTRLPLKTRPEPCTVLSMFVTVHASRLTVALPPPPEGVFSITSPPPPTLVLPPNRRLVAGAPLALSRISPFKMRSLGLPVEVPTDSAEADPRPIELPCSTYRLRTCSTAPGSISALLDGFVTQTSMPELFGTTPVLHLDGSSQLPLPAIQVVAPG